MRQLLAALTASEPALSAAELLSLEGAVAARLGQWAGRHTSRDYANRFRTALQGNLILSEHDDFARAALDLPRSQPGWARFLLEQTEQARLAVEQHLRLRRAQTLRDFAVEIARLDASDVRAFAAYALARAGQLAECTPAWGQIVLFRMRVEADQTRSLRLDQLFTRDFAPRAAALEPDVALTGRFEHDHPRLSAGPLLRVARSAAPLAIADIEREREREPDGLPDRPARSLICAPLTSQRAPAPDGGGPVYGALLLAWSLPARFTADDVAALADCGQLIATGLDRLAELKQRQEWMHEVMHDLSKTMRPLLNAVRDVAEPLGAALAASDLEGIQRAVREVNVSVESIRGLVFLTNDLMYWAADLSDDTTLPEDEESPPLEVSVIVEDLRDTTATLARILVGRRVIWEVPQDPLFVAGGETREHLIAAVLFKYIENGLKYGSRQDVRVTIAGDSGAVELAVCSTGRQVAADEMPRLFESGFRGSNVDRMLPGTGFGLAQVRRIADLLGGSVGYRAVGSDQNVFWLRLPTVAGPTA